MSDTSSKTNLSEILAEEFLELRRQGRHISIAEYCAGHSEAGDDLKRLLETIELMEGLPSGSVSDGSSGTRDHQLNVDEIGGYRIIGEIGRGGMGVVYEAEHISLRRRVALKVLPSQKTANKTARLRFEREARAAAKMHHSSIVPVFEVGNENDYFFYAMQLIQGDSLDELINATDSSGQESTVRRLTTFERNCPPSSSDSLGSLSGSNRDDSSSGYRRTGQLFRAIARIGLQAAEALEYSHVRGIIHRDVKPSNILLDESGVAWLTDFGLAKIAEEEITQTGDFLGTLRYMAPERFRGECDARADIYGLGLTLYELIAREPAFQSKDRLELINMIGKSAPTPLHIKDPKVPRDLETIVMKASEPDLSARYQDANELAEDLRRFLGDRPVKARRQPAIEQLYRWGRRNKRLAAAVSLATVLLVALASVTSLSSIKQAKLRDIAEGHSEELQRTGEELQRTLYYAEMNLGAALASGEAGVDQVEELTANWIPNTGEPDLRGWEWYYLRSLAGSEMHVLKRHDGEVWSVNWSPNRMYIASGAMDGTVMIFDAVSHELHHRLSHPKRVWSATWSPDGTKLATSCDDGQLRIFDANSWTISKAIDTGQNHVGTVNWSPNGERLVSCGTGNTAQIWDVATAEPAGAPMLHADDSVRGGVWSPDGRFVATASSPGNTIFIWDAVSPQHPATQELVGHAQINSLCWNSNGTQLASAGVDGSVRIWDVANGQQLYKFDHHVGEVLRIDWSKDDQWLVSPSRDGTIQIWDTETRKRHALFRVRADVNCTSFDRTGRWLAAGSADGGIRLWDLSSHKVDSFQLHDGPVRYIDWDRSGDSILSISDMTEASVWNLKTEEIESQLNLPASDRFNAVWSPDGKRLAVSTRDWIYVWEIGTQRELFRHKKNTRWNLGIWWSDDGSTLCSSASGVVNVWRTIDWTPQASLTPGQTSNDRIRNGCTDWVLMNVSDGTPQVADRYAESSKSLEFSHPDVIYRSKLSPNGDLAAGEIENDIVVWNPKSGRLLLRMSGHTKTIEELGWSPDGRRLATASKDGTLKIWDPKSGQLALTLWAGKSLRCLKWHPSGKKIVTGSIDGRIQIWDASAGYARRGE